MQHVFRRRTAQNTFAQAFQHLATLDDGTHHLPVVRPAIVFLDDQILRHIHQAAGQVAGVRGLQRRVGQTLTGAVRGDEVLQHVQAFAEVRGNRRLDDRAIGLGHQAAHAGELADLRRRAPGAGVGHHVDGIEGFLLHFLAVAVGGFLLGQLGHHHLGHVVRGLAPDVDHLVVPLAGRHQARGVLLLDFLHLGFGAADDVLLLRGHQHVFDRNRNARTRGQAETILQQLVGKYHGFLQAAFAEAAVDQLGNFLLLQRLVEDTERQPLGKDFTQQRPADRGFHQTGLGNEFIIFLVLAVLGQAHGDAAGEFNFLIGQRAFHLTDVGKDHAFTFAVDFFTRGVVQAQHHVLRRHDRRLTRSREQHVVGRQHEHAGFHLRFHRQRHVHSHLVTVEVGVERRTHQWMQLDSLAFDQQRLKRLNAETVQRRRPVQQHGVFLDHLFENVPHDRVVVLDLFFRRLDGGGNAHLLEAGEDERLEQFQRHELGQATLVQLERGAHGNHGTTGIVNALAQQVLAEATALALDHVGQRLERTLVGAGHRLAAAAVVEQAVHRLLQHALLVARNDFRRLQFEQTAQAAVAVDDAAVEIVQIRGRETAAIQRNERAQVGRQHRQHFHDHPLGLDAGFLERLEHFEALGVFLNLGFGTGQIAAQAFNFRIDVQAVEQLLDAFGSHLGDELISELGNVLVVFVLAHDAEFLQRRHAGIGHHIGLEVKHALDVAQRHVEHQAQAAGQALEEPDVRARRGQVDVAHALAAHLGLRHFHAALLADHPAMLEALVLATQTLVVLDGAKDLGTEQAVALGLEGAVVDGLGLFNFAIRPRTDLFRRCQADFDDIEMLIGLDLFEQVEQRFHGLLSLIRIDTKGMGTACGITHVPVRYQCPVSGFP